MSELAYTPTTIGQTLHVPCARGHMHDFTITGALPPEVVAKKMLQAGWTVGRKLVCPLHTRKPKPKAANELEEIEVAQPATNNVAPVQTSEQVREARRMAHMMLEEQFDIPKGCFKGGYTDKRIADECGVSEQWVKQRREEEFGPLKTPPEIAQASEELARMEETATNLRAHCLAVCDDLDKNIAQHRQRLAGLVRANNWNT